jgi:protein TonB
VQTPAAPQKVVVNAPRYLVEPRLSMPLASRRLGEQGLVQLRLHIGTDGQLISATVAKSSGFERLDAQALKDIRTARFSPLVENGRAVEWECLAPLAYELTR